MLSFDNCDILIGGLTDIIPPGECRECLDGSGCAYMSEFCDGYNTCDNGEDENEDICRGNKVYCLTVTGICNWFIP